MKMLQAFWRYWTWVCVALVTTCIVLGALTLIINHFKTTQARPQSGAEQCLDAGGTWEAEAQECRYPA